MTVMRDKALKHPYRVLVLLCKKGEKDIWTYFQISFDFQKVYLAFSGKIPARYHVARPQTALLDVQDFLEFAELMKKGLNDLYRANCSLSGL